MVKGRQERSEKQTRFPGKRSVQFWVPEELEDSLQLVADHEYEGSLAMTARVALRKFLKVKLAEYESTNESIAA